MKSLQTILLAAAIVAAAPAQAQVDVKAVVAEAIANTFEGKNYSWTTTMSRADGGSVTINGQTQGTTSLITITAENGTHTVANVGDKHYVNDGSGWKLAPAPGLKDIRIHTAPPAGRPRGPRVRALIGGPDCPEMPLTDAAERVTAWTTQGAYFVGEFTGPFAPGRGAPGLRDGRGRRKGPGTLPDAKHTVTLQIQEGAVASFSVVSTGTFTPRGESVVSVERRSITTLSNVGTTQLTLPSELQALIASGS